MTKKKPAGRPVGRPTGGKTGTSTVHKRGEGLGTGKVGNADYGGRTGGHAVPGSSSGPKGSAKRDIPNNPLGGIGGLGGSYQQGSSGGNGPLGSIGGLGGAMGAGGGMPPHGNNPFGGAPRRNGGGGLIRIILLVVLVLFIMNMLGMCGRRSSEDYGSQGYSNTPHTTAAPASSGSNTTSMSGHWNQPSTTYTDANQNSVSTAVASGARDKFTKLKGSGNDRVTMLVYMCGTDLETNYGMATSDLNEMLYATASDKINILVETGGTKRWQNSVIANTTNQRWIIQNRTITALDKKVGHKAMTDPATLSDFIRWGASNYPADRYILVLWDHGGGSISGYAHDELYPNGTMTADEISKALKDGGIKFDIVGFDACLMANMETAMAVEPYADYLLASEETEPGTGWYYTDWLSKLAGNTSAPTTDLGKFIIDDFINASYQSSSRDRTTLSLIDLAEFSGTVPYIFSNFAQEMMTTINSEDFRTVSNARSVTREFAESTKIDQIDLIHFCKNLNTAKASALADSLQSCVKYNRCNNVTNAYGMSIYFPYARASQVQNAVQVYENLGMDRNYTSAVRSYATMAASGQVVNGYNSNTLFDILGGGSSYSDYSTGYEPSDLLGLLLGGGSSGTYYDDSYTNSYGSGYSGNGFSILDLFGDSSVADDSTYDIFSQLYGRAHVDTKNLVLSTNEYGQNVLNLPQSDWDNIQDIKLNVWIDDGEGYIDLGMDSTYEFDDNGGLVTEFNGHWVGINDQAVAYFETHQEYISDTDYNYGGYIPVLYNGERADIIVEFTPDSPNGSILGIRKVYEDGMNGKGYIEMQDGDTIDFLCDYYDYQGNFKDTYYLGDQLVVSGDLEMTYDELVDVKALYSFRLTDIYKANMWTPVLTYEN